MTDASTPSEIPASTTKNPSRLVTVIGNLIVVLFSIVFTLLMIEVLMRVGFDLLPADIQGEIGHVRRVPWDETAIIPPVPFQSSRDYQAYLPPGLTDYPVRWRDARFRFSTRNLWDHPVGLRVDEPLWPVDIMVFGDSFAFCWTNVEDCWAQQLQTVYQWHVINAGQPGSGPGGQLPLIRDVGLPLEPSLIVWQHYDNDLMDDYILDTIRDQVSGLSLPPGPDPVRMPRGLAQYSAIAHLVDNRVDPPQKSNDFKHGQIVLIDGHEFIIVTDEYPPGNNTEAYTGIAYGYEQNIAHYQQGIDLVAEQLGSPVVIVMIPYKELVYADKIGDALPAEILDRMQASRIAMLDVCEERGWYCLDALPGLKDAANSSEERVYYAGDFHLAPYGNVILARLVRNYLLENDLIASREP